MKKREIEQKLKENGFEFVRRTKHETWSNGKRVIVLPCRSEINEGLAKDLLLQITRKQDIKSHRLAS